MATAARAASYKTLQARPTRTESLTGKAAVDALAKVIEAEHSQVPFADGSWLHRLREDLFSLRQWEVFHFPYSLLQAQTRLHRLLLLEDPREQHAGHACTSRGSGVAA
jgi:hypothetical protein